MTIAVFGLAVGAPWAAWGQYSTSSGTFGSRSIGQAMGGGSSSAFGGSGSGLGSAMSLGTGMSQGAGLGASFGSRSGSGSQTGRVAPFGNVAFPSPRYSTRQVGEFVGGDTRDIRTGILGGITGVSSSSNSSYGSTGYNNASGNGGYRRGSSGAYGSGYNRTQVYLGLDMGADLSVPANPQISSVVMDRLAKSMRLPTGAPVEVSVRGDTALLRGIVATPHDRALAEQLLRLEPGVSQVVNELQVAPAGATVGPTQESPGSAAPLP